MTDLQRFAFEIADLRTSFPLGGIDISAKDLADAMEGARIEFTRLYPDRPFTIEVVSLEQFAIDAERPGNHVETNTQ